MKKWEVEVDGVRHLIQYKKGFKNTIIVDGETYKAKSSNWFINILDYAIQFGDTTCQLVIVGTKVDLAVNGIFMGSNKPYEPISNVPALSWVFVGISTIGGLILCGIWGLLTGILMSTVYIQKGLEKKTGFIIGAFIGCSAIQILIFVVISSLLY